MQVERQLVQQEKALLRVLRCLPLLRQSVWLGWVVRKKHNSVQHLRQNLNFHQRAENSGFVTASGLVEFRATCVFVLIKNMNALSVVLMC